MEALPFLKHNKHNFNNNLQYNLFYSKVLSQSQLILKILLNRNGILKKENLGQWMTMIIIISTIIVNQCLIINFKYPIKFKEVYKLNPFRI